MVASQERLVQRGRPVHALHDDGGPEALDPRLDPAPEPIGPERNTYERSTGWWGTERDVRGTLIVASGANDVCGTRGMVAPAASYALRGPPVCTGRRHPRRIGGFLQALEAAGVRRWVHLPNLGGHSSTATRRVLLELDLASLLACLGVR